MKKAAIVVCALILVLWVGSTIAQEWSTAQKELWKTVEAYNAIINSGDVEGFMAYIHPDYLGWSYSAPMPRDRSTSKRWWDYDVKVNKVKVYDINPLGIKIFGSTAFVHYSFTLIYTDLEGKEKQSTGRWTDILMKQGDKWLIIGDHGGQNIKN
jgi:ketosteroid isomerase-like protein